MKVASTVRSRGKARDNIKCLPIAIKHGIGASDLPVLMEVSEYKSVLALYQEKCSRKPLDELHKVVQQRIETEKNCVEVKTLLSEGHYGNPIIDPDCDFNLSAEVGRALEPVIAKYLSCRFGFPVYKDTMMYRHPEYPFLFVDLDYMMLAPDRETGELNRLVIIECKTASWWKRTSGKKEFHMLMNCNADRLCVL